MARRQTGQLIWVRGVGWTARYYAIVDGERVRPNRVLQTTNKSVARGKLAKLIAERNMD
jgi:hypothetical protein